MYWTSKRILKKMKNHYQVGWNDLAHGILTWQPHEHWQSALEWALHCREIAQKFTTDYHKGTIAAVDQYQKTGRIAKL